MHFIVCGSQNVKQNKAYFVWELYLDLPHFAHFRISFTKNRMCLGRGPYRSLVRLRKKVKLLKTKTFSSSLPRVLFSASSFWCWQPCCVLLWQWFSSSLVKSVKASGSGVTTVFRWSILVLFLQVGNDSVGCLKKDYLLNLLITPDRKIRW